MLTGLLLLLVGDYLLVSGELYEGSLCSNSKGPGICRILQQCQSVIDDFTAGKKPEIPCGYKGGTPIVCCPSKNVPASVSTTTDRPIWGDFGGSRTTSTTRPIWGSGQTTSTSRPIWGSGQTTSTSRPIWGSDSSQTTSNNRPIWGTDSSRTTTSRPIWGGHRPSTTSGYNNWRSTTTTTRRPTVNYGTSVDLRATTPRNSLANARPARRMCAEYAKSVYALVASPALTVQQQYVNESLCAIKSKKLIVGGTKAEPKEFPHSVAIGFNGNSGILWQCGGSLVSDRFVLSAAHCLSSPQWGRAQWVRVGDLNLQRTDDDAQPQTRRIIERIKHQNYKPALKYNDIALFKMESPVTFNAYVRPACLDYNGNISPGEKVVATGWGKLGSNLGDGTSDDLLKVTVPILSDQKCQTIYEDSSYLPDGIDEKAQFCAGESNKDTCQGDSGGPLAIYSTDEECMYNVIGVTSFGSGCGQVAGVYVRVFHYLPWLESVIWPSN